MERKKGQEINKIPTRMLWGRALENLRADRRNMGINRIEEKKIMSRYAYREMIRGGKNPRKADGPGFTTIYKLLKLFQCTWKDFAEEVEKEDLLDATVSVLPAIEKQPTRQVAGQAKRVEVTFEDEPGREMSYADIMAEFSALRTHDYKIEEKQHAQALVLSDLTAKVDAIAKLLKRGNSRSA